MRDIHHSREHQELKTKGCRLVASGLRSFFLLVFLEMSAQAVDHVVFVPFLHFFLYFFQREVHDVVMVHLQGCHRITETQPQPVQKIDLVGGQIRGMRSENLVKLVTVG